MAGKDKVERGFRILFENAASSPVQKDLTGDLIPGSVSGGGMSFDEADMTSVSDSVKKFLTGHASSEITARFHMNDTVLTGATSILNSKDGGSGTLTLRWGSDGAAPTTGDPEWEGEYTLVSLSVVLDGNKFVHDCRFLPQSGAADPAWGTVT